MQLQIKETNANAQCRTQARQEAYTLKASQLVEENLKKTLEELSKYLFGKGIQYRWVDAYFPFTHPSFELEILLRNKWTEVLGCGVMEQKILEKGLVQIIFFIQNFLKELILQFYLQLVVVIE